MAVAELDKHVISDFTQGMNTKRYWDRPRQAPLAVVNAFFDRYNTDDVARLNGAFDNVYGKPARRRGIDYFTNQIGSSYHVKGLHVYDYDNEGTVVRYYMAAYGDDVYYTSTLKSGSWTALLSGALTAGQDVEFVNFGDGRVYLTNGVENVQMWDGTSAGSAASVQGKFIEEFQGRLFLGNVPGAINTVRFSAVADGTSWDANDVIKLPSEVTGLRKFKERLLIFTRNEIYTWDGYNLNAVGAGIGTLWHRSVGVLSDRVIFLDSTGTTFYEFDGYNDPRPILVEEIGNIGAYGFTGTAYGSSFVAQDKYFFVTGEDTSGNDFLYAWDNKQRKLSMVKSTPTAAGDLWRSLYAASREFTGTSKDTNYVLLASDYADESKGYVFIWNYDASADKTPGGNETFQQQLELLTDFEDPENTHQPVFMELWCTKTNATLTAKFYVDSDIYEGNNPTAMPASPVGATEGREVFKWTFPAGINTRRLGLQLASTGAFVPHRLVIYYKRGGEHAATPAVTLS